MNVSTLTVYANEYCYFATTIAPRCLIDGVTWFIKFHIFSHSRHARWTGTAACLVQHFFLPSFAFIVVGKWAFHVDDDSIKFCDLIRLWRWLSGTF